MEESTVVVVSYSGKEINAKLVYYGAGLSGKTTNLESIYEAVPDSSRGKMVSMKTQSDRTLFFDLLPLDLGEIMGFKTRFLLYTVPGQVFYNATRKLVLKGADAIVFVADSEVGKMDENKESLSNLRANLNEYGLKLDEIPWVIQYNKRDLPELYSVEELNRELNPENVPSFEAVATEGRGVFETFRGISQMLMEKVTKELKRGPLAGQRSKTEDSATGNSGSFHIPTRAQATPAAPAAPSTPKQATRETPAEPSRAGGNRGFDYGRELDLSTPITKTPSVAPPAETIGAAQASGPLDGPNSGSMGVMTGDGVRVMNLSSTSPARPGFAVQASVPARSEEGAEAPHEVQVPIHLPRRGTREIVIRIVLSDEA